MCSWRGKNKQHSSAALFKLQSVNTIKMNLKWKRSMQSKARAFGLHTKNLKGMIVRELGNLCSFAEETSEVDFEINPTHLAFLA